MKRSINILQMQLLCLLLAASSLQFALAEQSMQSLDPGKSHEVCMALTPGEQLDYSFTAGAGLRFNIHYHADGKVSYPVPEVLTETRQGQFRPDSPQKYCMMWTNPAGTPVAFELTYKRRTAD